MSSEFLVQKVGGILEGSEGKTLKEMIQELGTSKVSALKWLQSLERNSLIYRTPFMNPGRKGRPQNVYHPTKNLKALLEKESENAMVVLDFFKLKTMCRYEKGEMCKAFAAETPEMRV